MFINKRIFFGDVLDIVTFERTVIRSDPEFDFPGI